MRTISVGILLGFFLIVNMGAHAQNLPNKLTDKKITIDFEELPYEAVLGYLVGEGLPIGFEEAVTDRDNSLRKFSINPPYISVSLIEQ